MPEDDLRKALASLMDLLTLYGVANDAADHGSGAEAAELRLRAASGIRRIAEQHAVVRSLIPDLEKVLETELLTFTWPTVAARVRRELAALGANSASE